MNSIFTIRMMSARLPISILQQNEFIIKNVLSTHRNYNKCLSIANLCTKNSQTIFDQSPSKYNSKNVNNLTLNVQCIRTLCQSTVLRQQNPSKSDGKICEDSKSIGDENNPEKPLGLVAKFKLMYKQYWYVLVPVHLITSTGWMIGFYYLSKSGVDIPAVLETLSVNESIIEKLKNSSMGHLAIAYVCYKLATPLRYMLTVGGTTVSIKHLSRLGYIRPILSKEQFKKMYDDRKAQIKKGYEDLQDKRTAAKQTK